MANVSTIAPVVRRIEVPAELRSLQGWLMWRYEQFTGEEKPRKVPYWTDGVKRYGKQGGPVDRERLTTFGAARDAAARGGFTGVGFAPLPEFGLAFLDFDACVDADGNVDDSVLDLVSMTYAEYSPSGKGVRAVLRGDLGNHKSHASAERFGVETFSSSGYVTFTGNVLPIVEILGTENMIASVSDKVIDFCRERFGTVGSPEAFDPDDFMAGHEPVLGLSEERMRELLAAISPDCTREEWIRVGMALHHETDGSDLGFELWDEWSSDGITYPSTEGVRTQWDSFERRRGRSGRQITMASVIKMAKQALGQNNTPVTSEALQHVADNAPSTYTGRFAAVPAAKLNLLPKSQWIIKGILPRSADPSLLFGASGSGKSFLALDMALAIARGEDWFGHRSKQTRVVYLAAEGGSGVGKRIKAYCDRRGVDIDKLPIDVITGCPNILEQDDISELVRSLAASGPYGLVIVDTLAQVTPGANENTAEDMGRALANLKALGEATGATVQVVHHAGKDLNRGSRGWSGIKAAMDSQLEVQRDPDTGTRSFRVEKMKDGEDGAQFAFKLDVVDLGVDEDGDLITSCVVEVDNAPAPAAKGERKGVKRRGHIETHILEVMSTFGALDVVETEDLIKRAIDMLPKPDKDGRDTRRQTVARALTALSKEKDGPLQVLGGRVIFYE